MAETAIGRARPQDHRWIRQVWRFLRNWPVLPVVILVVLVVPSILGPLIAPYNAVEGDTLYRLAPPFDAQHWLGTDHVGRDILSRMILGGRVTIMVAVVSMVSGFVVGTALGIVAGYVGGITDEIITRAVDIWQSLPFLMVALVVVQVMGQTLTVLLALLALLAWSPFVRVIRGQVLSLKEMDYVALARIAGASPVWLMWRHMFPGVLNTAAVVASLRVGQLILAEATLSFLGAGIPPPTPSWGVMVSEGRDYVASAWWATVFPGAAICLIVMSMNFLGDWLRDKLDPRLRQLGAA
ncbi:MAG: ABC transporter permease [Chloroflexota bacterium]|nr:ABC transporter permease [Chloroflexota bacterium]